jgi:hypothetical protein
LSALVEFLVVGQRTGFWIDKNRVFYLSLTRRTAKPDITVPSNTPPLDGAGHRHREKCPARKRRQTVVMLATRPS